MLLWPGQRLVGPGVEDVSPMDEAAAGIGEDFGHAVDKILLNPVRGARCNEIGWILCALSARNPPGPLDVGAVRLFSSYGRLTCAG